jgi:plastocyanin
MTRSLKIVLLFSLTMSSGLCPAETLRLRITDASSGEVLENAVVEVLHPETTQGESVQATDVLIDQIDKEFVPRVTIAVKGTQIRFPNSDNILHHVYSFSTTKVFDIPLYGQGSAEFSEVFDKPGVVEIGCNIHDWMLAFIYIAESDRVAKTDGEGIAEISNLPPGAYSLKIWHPRLPNQDAIQQQVQLGINDTTALSISIAVGVDRRIRRAPSSVRGRYR